MYAWARGQMWEVRWSMCVADMKMTIVLPTGESCYPCRRGWLGGQVLAKMSITTLELEDNTTEDSEGREVECGSGVLARIFFCLKVPGYGFGVLGRAASMPLPLSVVPASMPYTTLRTTHFK